MFFFHEADRPVAPAEAARRFIEGLDSGTGLLVAVSGGSDSTGLLLALREALDRSGRSDLRLHAATIDHALRPEAADEALGVAALCARAGISHHIRRWEAVKPATGLSAAAREARYALLSEIATETGSSAIVTAHTAGDQMETSAMRAGRNDRADMPGLAGMAGAVLYRRRHWILRPFLASDRQQIRDYLTARGVGWIDDPGNSNLRSERIRIRQSFASNGGADIAALFAAGRRREVLSGRAADLLLEHGSVHHGVLGRIRCEGADAAVLCHLLGTLAAVFGGRSHVPASATMDRLMAFIETGQPGRLSAGRALFDLRRDALYIYRENRSLASLALTGGQTALWDNRFRVANAGERAVTLEPGLLPELTFPGDVPPGVVSRMASAAYPCAKEGEGGVSVERVLAIFDHFLPGFDLALANRIAIMSGLEPFGQPPFANLTATY